MESLILHEITSEDLKKIIREALDEKSQEENFKRKSDESTTYLNRFEVVKILKISLPTLNNWSKAGILQSYRIGNRVLYKADEINQAVQSVRNIKYKKM